MAYIYYTLFRKNPPLPHHRVLEERISHPNRQKAAL